MYIYLQVALFKFIRGAGDLLPAPLYIPYINMLAGLAAGPQAAQHCFNLLKANGSNSGRTLGFLDFRWQSKVAESMVQSCFLLLCQILLVLV